MCKKVIVFSMFVLAVCLSSELLAAACEVGSPAELKTILSTDGSCATEDAVWRQRYDNLRGNFLKFRVVHFSRSMELDASDVATISNATEALLIIVAEKNARVVVSGSNRITIPGSAVLLDNVRFKGVGLDIIGDSVMLVRSEISDVAGTALQIYGSSSKVIDTIIRNNKGSGIYIDDRSIDSTCTADKYRARNTRVEGGEIYSNGEYGIYVRGHKTQISKTSIHDNARDGVYTSALIGGNGCMNIPANDIVQMLRTTEIDGASFYDNGGRAIAVSSYPLATITGLMDVSSLSDGQWTVVGTIVANDQIPLNLDTVRIDIYVADSSQSGEGETFIGSTTKVDKASKKFVLKADKTLDGATLVATITSLELNSTSPFSSDDKPNTGPSLAPSVTDWDGDGLANDQEDYNHNGIVDIGETDPSSADSDGDGLTDGEERLRIGRVGKLLSAGFVVAAIEKLSPVNPDSDNDCLPDGLELGVSEVDLLAISKPTKIFLVTSSCRAILKQNGTIALANAVSFNVDDRKGLDNIAMLFDTDPTTMTDPTNGDSDGDGLSDGEEDANFSGARDMKAVDSVELAVVNKDFLETDTKLADSDGDSIIDGDEGDKNKSGKLDAEETSALSMDTDGDGVADNLEGTRYGSLPNQCDSDGDGLPDGVEAGIVNPNLDNAKCRGLQPVGTNYAQIDVMSLISNDSDGDGLIDGDEDANGNGWVDAAESDPSISDTDADGVDDYVENTLDNDKDGNSDVDLSLIDNGSGCKPPTNAADLDCDGVVNSQDDDSDGDGCADSIEAPNKDTDGNNIMDWMESAMVSCKGQAASGGGAAAPAASAPAASESEEKEAKKAYTPWVNDLSGGGDCSLVAQSETSRGILVLVFALVVLFCLRVNAGRKWWQ